MAVTFDAAGAADVAGNTVTSVSLTTLTVGSGTNRALVVQLCWDTTSVPPAGISVVWDSGGSNQSCTLITSQAAPSFSGCALYGLINPVSGNKTLKASWTSGQRVYMQAVSWTGVDQTGGATSFPHATGAQGTSLTPAVTVTSATNNAVMAVFSGERTMSAVTNTQTFLDNSLANSLTGSGSRAAGAASVGSQCTVSSSTAWAACGCDILAAATQSPLDQNPIYYNPNLPVGYNQYTTVSDTYLIGLDSTVFGRTYYVNPTLPVPYNQYWIENNTYLIGKDTLPFRTDTKNPTILVLRNPIDWQDYFFLGLAGEDALPAGVQRWAVPYGPVPKVADWQAYLNPPAFPTVSVRTEVPLGPTTNPFWIQYTLPFNYPAVVNTPNVSQVFFVPISSTPGKDWQSFIIPSGQDKLPYNQYNWSVPKSFDRTDNGWVLSFSPELNAVVVLPFNQYLWPNPQTSASVDTTWIVAYNNTLNAVVATPFNQYNWPNPNFLQGNLADWQFFLTNIPIPEEVISSGRYIDDAEIEEGIRQHWRWRQEAQRHIAAVVLGRKGGQAYARNVKR